MNKRGLILLLVFLLGMSGKTGIVQAGAALSAEPPMPPLAPSPVRLFRDLLQTNEAGRVAFLATRSESQRGFIREKLEEYEALPPTERELRLTLTDLRWYLLYVIRSPENYRQEYLAQVPDKFRPLVQDRLAIWDGLTPEEGQELLENEAAMGFIVRLEKATPPQSRALLSALPAAKRQEIEVALGVWRKMSREQQQAVVGRFNQFFDLTEREKQQTLAAIPADRRTRTERILAAFEQLPKAQRDKCVAAFEQFLKMSPSEKEQFLRNAARWQAMSAADRQAVREALQKFPPLPPLPPTFFQWSQATVSAAGPEPAPLR